MGLAWRMGYTIALPLVAFALGGRLLDKTFTTSPFFLLAGILVSIILSTIGIYRITMPVLNSLDKPTTNVKDNPDNNTTL